MLSKRNLKKLQKKKLKEHSDLCKNILKRKKINKMKTIKEATNFEELLEIKYGNPGSPKREEFETKSKAFIIGEMIKEARKEAKLTQEELAQKTGTKKSYISRLENGKIDIQISTLFKIFEEGLGRKLGLTIS